MKALKSLSISTLFSPDHSVLSQEATGKKTKRLGEGEREGIGRVVDHSFAIPPLSSKSPGFCPVLLS